MPQDAGQTGADKIISFFQRIRQRSQGGNRQPPGEPFDARALPGDPAAVLEQTRGQPALLSIPVERCRGLMPIAFPLSSDANHPYLLSARAYIESGHTAYSGSWLEAYHQRVQPARAFEVQGITGAVARALQGAPTRASVLPWEGVPGKRAERRILRQMKKDLGKHGLASPDEARWHEVGGPVSSNLGRIEINRIRELVDSIRERGYLEGPDQGTPLTGTLLIADGPETEQPDWAVRVRGGQHRAAVLAALGHSTLPVVFEPKQTVYRSRVTQWPAVRARVLSKEQALMIFDRIVQGRQPEFMQGCWPPAEIRD